ncbi:MAG: hypothetical protein WBC45_07040 [Atribacterota bacterium]
MVKKILYIKPTYYNALNYSIKEYLEKYKDANTEIDVVNISKGPKHLGYTYYESLASLEILDWLRKLRIKVMMALLLVAFMILYYMPPEKSVSIW